MILPRRGTAVFKVLEGLTKHGDMSVDEMISTIGHVTEKAQRHSFVQLLKRMVVQKYITVDKHEQYKINEDIKNYVEEIIEATIEIKLENIVQPAYRNLFTPEMKNYNLFANKRHYQR